MHSVFLLSNTLRLTFSWLAIIIAIAVVGIEWISLRLWVLVN
jgi:hypothetical protein